MKGKKKKGGEGRWKLKNQHDVKVSIQMMDIK